MSYYECPVCLYENNDKAYELNDYEELVYHCLDCENSFTEDDLEFYDTPNFI